MSEEYFDVIVIGAGPGGLQASYELKERKINHVVLEKEQNTSSTFSRFPIHRKLISISKKYNFFPEEDFNLRHDWNSLLSRPTELKEGQKKMLMTDWTDELFPSADVLFEYLNEYATRFELPIRHSVEVTSVKKEKSSSSSSSSSEDSHFLIQTSSGSLYRTPLLLCGTGAVAPYIPNIPGIEEAEQYIDHNPDPSRYINKRVLIVGGGNSGFETADFLAGHAAIIHVALRRPVRHAWDSHFVGDLRAVNNNLLDMYQLKSLHATIGDPPQSIEKNEDGTFTVTFLEFIGHPDIALGNITLKRIYDAVICCTGFEYLPKFLKNDSSSSSSSSSSSPLSCCVPETHTFGKYPVLSPLWESVNVKNLYFIGTSMQGNDRKAASGFIHGFRYNVQTLINVLSHLHFQSPLPSLPPLSPLSPLSIEGISTRICDRLTVVSALFQMFGKLCDVLHVGPLEKEKEKEIKEKEEIKEEEEDPLFSHTLYTQLPREWVLSGKEKASLSLLQGAQHVFLISLQFGFSRYPSSLSSNDFLQDSGTLLSKCGAFLHPVIEHCVNGVIVETYHLFETLDIRFNLEYKKGESGSTLNSRLLVDILKECLLSSSSSSSSSPSLARLTAASTPIEEKRELFKKLIPVDHVWTEEELKVWRNFLEIKREEEKRDTECVFRPVPVSQSDIEIAREKTKGM